MKQTFKTLLAIIFMLCAAAGVAAQTIDLGELELGKAYELTAYKPCKATFTAPETGTLVASCTRSYWPEPYLDAEYTQPVDYKHSYVSTGSIWEFQVEEGVTYYFYRSFLFDGGTFSIDYAATEVVRKGILPEVGSVLDISGTGQINIEYNMNVNVSDVTLAVNGTVLGTGVAYVSGRNVAIQLKGENSDEINILALLKNGTLKGGETLELSFVVTSANDPSLVLNETLTYVCPEMLVQLVSVKEIPEFLSYWFPGDESGVMTLVFDSPLKQPTESDPSPYATLQYGNPESGIEGDCYIERLGVAVDGCSLIVNFTGVRRRAADMLTSGNTYNTMLVKISGVKDTEGRYVHTGASGSLGSFSYEFDYKTVNTEAVYEFTPAPGTTLTASEIELWIQSYATIRFDGVTYSYADEGGNEVAITKPLEELSPEVDEYGDCIVMIPVSEDIRTKENLKISLSNLMFADGVEREISAVYNPKKEDVGIQDIESDQPSTRQYFTVDGRRQATPVRGINIVRQANSDGTVVTYKHVDK